MAKRKLLLIGGSVYTPRDIITPGAVLVEGEHILAVGPAGEFSTRVADLVIDVTGQVIAPGLIDLHIHGGAGAEVMDGTVEALERIAGFLVQHGTTGFLPTVLAAPLGEMMEVTRAIVATIKQGGSGAQILGINLEGPFLNPHRKGAQREDGILPPDPETLQKLLACGEGWVKMMTLAPELKGAEELLDILVKQGVTVAIGHSDATFDQVVAAVKRGLAHVTHTFNAMSGFHHREPGVAGAALVLEELTAEVIADGVHVHPAALKLLVKTKGSNAVALVTDAMRATGLPAGEYDLGGQRVWVEEQSARLASGILAGSILTLDRAVKNMVEKAGIGLQEALTMASTTPAKILGLDKRKGNLAAGYDADIVVLSPGWEVKLTIIRGEIVYRA